MMHAVRSRDRSEGWARGRRAVAWAVLVSMGSWGLARGLPDPKTGAGGKPLRLLFVVPRDGWQPKAEIDAEYRRHLEGRGFEVKLILGNSTLTVDYLKQFHCVVVPGMDSSRLVGYRAPHLLEMIVGVNNERVYRDYIAGGGGVLFHTRCSDIGPQCAATFSEILEP